MASMNVDAIVRQCRGEYDNAVAFKRGRVKDWQGTEDLYFGRTKKQLANRFNIPMPVMSGFVDTLLSKIDDAPVLRFKSSEESDFRGTQKVQSFYDAQSKSEDNDFDSKDLDAKKLAVLYGRAIFKTYGESEPKFKFCIHVTDPYDFFVDPTAGGNLEDARYLGEDNIFRSKSDLVDGANAGYYDKKATSDLVNGLVENTIKDNDNTYRDKANRLSALGLSASMYNFMGEGMMRFIEQGTVYRGERYHVIWDYATGVAIRCVKWEEDFKSGLWCWTSWATNRDSFNFWSKAPCDDMRPVAEAIKILANQELDNRQKKNFGMRAVDPEVFPNLSELEWRPNGIVSTKAGASSVRQIGSAIYEFQTPELNGTINLVNWLDNFVGTKTGITAQTQGAADEAKVGIYQGNLQQVADRLGLYNKSYVKCHAAIGRRFVWACYEHLNKGAAVRLIGENGVEWDTLKGNEVNPDMDIKVESGASELQINNAKKEARSRAMASITTNPVLSKQVNPQWQIEQILLNGEFTDEEVRVALDVENNGNRIVLARASEAIEDIVEGKKPKLFRGATTAFQQKIVDFASDNTDGDLELFNRLMAYSTAHDQLVMDNMSRRAISERQKQGVPPPQPQNGAGMPGAGAPEPTQPMGPTMPIPQTPSSIPAMAPPV